MKALSNRACSEIQLSLNEAVCNLIVRHWLEVKRIILEYLLKSPEQPLGKVTRLFSRDEYQGESGNLPHKHMLVTLEAEYATNEGRAFIQSVVRGFVDDIVTDDEVESFIREGILEDHYDYHEMKLDAQKFLPHYHSPCCLR